MTFVYFRGSKTKFVRGIISLCTWVCRCCNSRKIQRDRPKRRVSWTSPQAGTNRVFILHSGVVPLHQALHCKRITGFSNANAAEAAIESVGRSSRFLIKDSLATGEGTFSDFFASLPARRTKETKFCKISKLDYRRQNRAVNIANTIGLNLKVILDDRARGNDGECGPGALCLGC